MKDAAKSFFMDQQSLADTNYIINMVNEVCWCNVFT